jgi:hypothetical protein
MEADQSDGEQDGLQGVVSHGQLGKVGVGASNGETGTLIALG